MKNNLPDNVTTKDLEKVQESLKITTCEGKKKRVVYGGKDKQEIAKYAAVCGVTAAIRKFKQKFPNLNESTVRPWVKSHKKFIREQKKQGESMQCPVPSIGKVRVFFIIYSYS